MSFEIADSFKMICDVILNKSSEQKLTNRYEFKELLVSLSAIERFLIAKYFCKLLWNVGSLRVLGVLQELRILTATEFILLCQKNTEQMNLILNDFLEAEYELLTNLFISSYYDSSNAIKLGSVLDECLRSLFTDLIQSPNLNDLSYLRVAKETLPINLWPKLAQKHVDIILELHKSNLSGAFKNFSTWINEGVDDIKFTKDLVEKLLCFTEQEMISYLFKVSQMEHFKEWKFYLILLQTIASKCSSETSSFIRKYLKARLRQIAAVPSITSMQHLLLSTRASTASTLDINKNLDAYADWYKQNISDMKFVLKTEEFQNVLTLLEQSISYEMEEDYLEIHATISISPPVLCGKLVQAYKTKCKLRLSQLKRKVQDGEKPLNANESIVIEDSD